MARKIKKLEEWRPVVEAFKASGQSVSAFCRERGLKREYFLNRRKALREKDERAIAIPTGFEAVCAPGQWSGARRPEQLSLEFGSTKLKLPRDVEARWVAGLMRALADATVS